MNAQCVSPHRWCVWLRMNFIFSSFSVLYIIVVGSVGFVAIQTKTNSFWIYKIDSWNNNDKTETEREHSAQSIENFHYTQKILREREKKTIIISLERLGLDTTCN